MTTEARLRAELARTREEAAIIVAEARRRARQVPATSTGATANDEAAPVDEDLARELRAIEEDLARRLAAHDAARGTFDELASFAVDRLLAIVAQGSGP